jgi:hypothetical protein
MTDEARLLAKLPAAAQDAYRRALAAKDSDEDVKKALAAVAFPMPDDVGSPVYPLASTLDEAQRALAELSCAHSFNVWPYALPGPTVTRKRWLGLEPPSALESTFVDGEPLWRALQLAKNVRACGRILDALPNLVALDALAEILLTRDMNYRVDATEILIHANLRVVRQLKDEAGQWAVKLADRVPDDNGPHRSMLAMLVFVALARAGIAIEQRWERLFPNLDGVSDAIVVECACALPADRRDAVLVEEIKRSLSMDAALRILAKFPSTEVARAMLARLEVNSQRWKLLVTQLGKLAKKHAAIAEALNSALGTAPPAIELVVASSRRPKTAAELGEVERKQVRIGTKRYDGLDLTAEERLTASTDRNDETFRGPGSIEFRKIADGEGRMVYDMLLYMGDAGSIFRAGTTKLIGEVIQGGVDLVEKQPALRTALQLAADTHVPRGAPKPKTKKAPKTKTPKTRKPKTKAKKKTKSKR